MWHKVAETTRSRYSQIKSHGVLWAQRTSEKLRLELASLYLLFESLVALTCQLNKCTRSRTGYWCAVFVSCIYMFKRQGLYSRKGVRPISHLHQSYSGRTVFLRLRALFTKLVVRTKFIQVSYIECKFHDRCEAVVQRAYSTLECYKYSVLYCTQYCTVLSTVLFSVQYCTVLCCVEVMTSWLTSHSVYFYKFSSVRLCSQHSLMNSPLSQVRLATTFNLPSRLSGMTVSLSQLHWRLSVSLSVAAALELIATYQPAVPGVTV